MKLTPRTLTIKELLDTRPCYSPLEETAFAPYSLTEDTVFNVFDLEAAYKKELIPSDDLGWLTGVLNLFSEPNWLNVALLRMAELKGVSLLAEIKVFGIGTLDDRTAFNLVEEECFVNDLFFQVVHEFSEGQPLIDWEVTS